MATNAAAKHVVKHTVSTDAGRLIQRRATTGSVSSVFYIKELAGKGDATAHRQARQVEDVFKFTVGLPIAMLGCGGLYHQFARDCDERAAVETKKN
mmetsp:Transcript_44945/g.109136  ORF Transcript_44945/g.109136 Transcript_44945/m.109136 type:complete len:96 (+) Transcript_44945:308-595(+)